MPGRRRSCRSPPARSWPPAAGFCSRRSSRTSASMARASPRRGSTSSSPGIAGRPARKKAPATIHTRVVTPTAERNAIKPSCSNVIPNHLGIVYARGRIRCSGAEWGRFPPQGKWVGRRTAASGLCSRQGALSMRDAPPIFFLRHQKENAPRPVEKKKCSAGRSAQAQTSCRRRGMVGSPLRRSGTETPGPWGDLQPGEVRDTSSFFFRCRWPVIDESFSIGQGNSFYDRPGSA